MSSSEKWFFAVFDGIGMVLFLQTRQDPSPNPEGIESLSPAVGPIPEGLPWVTALKLHNPEGVEYQSLMKQIQLFQSCDFSVT